MLFEIHPHSLTSQLFLNMFRKPNPCLNRKSSTFKIQLLHRDVHKTQPITEPSQPKKNNQLVEAWTMVKIALAHSWVTLLEDSKTEKSQAT